MNLYMLRHASAGTSRANPSLDRKRPLDRDGKQHCMYLAHVLNALKIGFDRVISSPLKRSLQTAQLVATETGFEAEVLLSKALAPQATVPDFARLVEEHRGCENLLLVGHSPNIQVFLGSLLVAHGTRMAGPDEIAKDSEPAHAIHQGLPQVRMRKGSFARIVLTRRPGTLGMLLDPRLVRSLYLTSTKSSRRNTS